MLDRPSGPPLGDHGSSWAMRSAMPGPDAADVRLAPDSGAKADIAGGPRSANSRPEQVQQTQATYSITSSARQ